MATQEWNDLDLQTRKDAYEKQALAQELEGVITAFARTYCHMARALADEFGEEVVLDSLEKTFWDMQYEAGLSWREDFERDLQGMFDKMTYGFGPEVGSLGCYYGAISVPIQQPNRSELIACSCYHDVFRKMNERKIGISWCMSDIAAVRGWSPRTVMDFPQFMLRGNSYCHQVRMLLDQPADPSTDEWTREKSERWGWRSIKKLEEA